MRVATLLVVSLAFTGSSVCAEVGRPAPTPTQIVAPAGAVVEQYRLNAQYRGTVKKGFSDIGRGYGMYHPGASGTFSVKLDGSVEDPESKELYKFYLEMDFQAQNGQIRDVKNKNKYSANAQDYHDRVEIVVPFIHLVKFTPPPRQSEEPTRIYRYRGKEYRLRYMTAERNIEATLNEGDTMIGKFFLSRDPSTPLGIEKFRVPTEGNVVLSFVKM